MTMRLAAIGLLGSARAGLPATERAASSVAHERVDTMTDQEVVSSRVSSR